jgi:hypothetical protein
LDLVSVDYLTNASVDWSDFFVAYWGWVKEGSFRWPVPPLTQDGRCGSHHGFGSHQLSDECLSWLVRFFCGSFGWVEECSFRWPVPSLIQEGHLGSHLGFGYSLLSDKRQCRLHLVRIHDITYRTTQLFFLS